ncbi:hypothetical protein J5069_19060 [Candidatus Symbiopectobacterium sp. NZEC127]|uniref:hypothetical protein n=1 Tax=Candidatus Symbiopectobacterium sp. NZEC127 TaxID=2820472 RepID=UPI002227FC0B|nr:hypothetical protein [Candidatus Symbiopectobacterium sp. NZEC127]MCW2488004.1 hypothetical protein [Candidatus Symbiopectobacterium sp. NZEC127]
MFSHIPSHSPSLPPSSPLKTEQHNPRDGRYTDNKPGSSCRNVTENLNLIANNAATLTRSQEQEIAAPTYKPAGSMSYISIAEGQHLRHLRNFVDSSYKISGAIDDKEQVILQLKNIYSEEYLNKSIAGPDEDMDELIDSFNKQKLYVKFHFIDLFSIYDYGKDGYVDINKTLLALPPGALRPPHIAQLALTLHHLAMKQANDDEYFSNAVPLFRGEVRKSEDFEDIEEGDIFSSPIFFSTSDDQDVAESFLGDKDALEQGEINVLYTIEKITPYSGAHLSDIMDDRENEFLFLPNIKFIITEKEFNEEDSTLNVTMSQLPISKNVFFEQLNTLIKQAVFAGDFTKKMSDMTLTSPGINHRNIEEYLATVKTPDQAMMMLHQIDKEASIRAKNAVKHTLDNISHEATTSKKMKIEEAIKPPGASPVTEQDKNREIEYRLKKIKAFRAALNMEKLEQRLSVIRQFNLDSYADEQGRGDRSEQGTAMRSPHDHGSK